MVGPDLQKLQSQQQGKRFALNTALRIGEQTLAAIRDMHRSGYIHKDISPSNFAIGIDPAHHTIFILDFGSAEKISDIKRLANRRIFAGNYKYASLSAFRLKPMSYKDDLESWWYAMVELIVGRLPWNPSDKTQKNPQAMIGKRMQMRTKSNLEKTCRGPCQSHLIKMIKLIDLIQVNEVPDYDALYDIIASAQKANDCNHEEALEWDPIHDYAGPPYQKGRERPKG
ncbi:hypothetical protein WR25_22109 [Diploscapter pachys]|uniref:Protein kinase domain-containing protein n=1 Tax=Diploscapter pachys TaxID=2018661 RepID=A0A2A2JGU4_9BILA|nr:hypothetical protein WR25_22109 [Diploscapter pachys]